VRVGVCEAHGHEFANAELGCGVNDSRRGQAHHPLSHPSCYRNDPSEGRIDAQKLVEPAARQAITIGVPPGTQVTGQTQIDEAIPRVEQEESEKLISRSRAPVIRWILGRWQQSLMRKAPLIPVNAPVELNRWQLVSIMKKHQVQERQAARVDVIRRRPITQLADHLYRHLQMLRRNEQVDVA